jgi:hypothetical protein
MGSDIDQETARGGAIASSEDGRQPMGVLLRFPLGSVAGDTTALRREVVSALRERRPQAVEEMAAALKRAGLAGVLELGPTPVELRLDSVARVTLAAWEHNRSLRTTDLEELRHLAVIVARAGVPLSRLLASVNVAARAGWEYAADQAVAVLSTARPGLAGRIVGDLSIVLLELLGRIEGQLAVGYAEGRRSSDDPLRLPTTQG